MSFSEFELERGRPEDWNEIGAKLKCSKDKEMDQLEKPKVFPRNSFIKKTLGKVDR